MRGRDRLIVALDVPTVDEALAVTRRLGDEVAFYKIGWQIFMTGELLRLLAGLPGKDLFVDLKVPGDIGNTIKGVIDACVRMNVSFLTLSGNFVPEATIEAAKAARGDRERPRLLMVPFLSSLDERDLQRMLGQSDVDEYIVERSTEAARIGCEGLIVSGTAIESVRAALPEVTIVSPGIRPSGSARDDQKRVTTPADAIRMGADYLVVGRPILADPDPAAAARRVVAEIEGALVQS